MAALDLSSLSSTSRRLPTPLPSPTAPWQSGSSWRRHGSTAAWAGKLCNGVWCYGTNLLTGVLHQLAMAMTALDVGWPWRWSTLTRCHSHFLTPSSFCPFFKIQAPS
ncbi:hypothetical protein E2562_030958 [Oryza meyeriana var. granulata]|uniref:Uncharacterized protein n=1 Tax=Oryza meyeriana var. granulata TaxID=110450 RepID=A0A6G1E4L2_9ORYZ|nr:hypothetical protein E2562_030958 [Oryza meyeriana var. granulata]